MTIVMKFGGSSVKDAAALSRVTGIVQSRLAQRPVVVVSALGDTTDRLQRILDGLAAGRAAEARVEAAGIAAHHRQVLETLLPEGPPRQQAEASLAEVVSRLGRLIDGMEALAEVSPRSRDAVLGLGETAAAPVLAAALASRGLPATAVDPMRLIATDDNHGAARPLREETDRRCRAELSPLIDGGRVPVTGGFVGAGTDGQLTTLGRGGSDLTASLVARALKAERLEYWKDVDGILTADPSLVAAARPLPRVSFREASELSFLGARVLHPAAMQPAVEAGVEVRVLNSHDPTVPGTAISREPAPGEGRDTAVTSVACKRGQLLVNVYSSRMLGATGFLRRVFEVFDRLELSVDHIATSEVNVTVTLGATPRIGELRRELGEVAEVEIAERMGVVSVVGERLTETPGVASRIFAALEGINVRLITYGGSGVNLSLVVDDEAAPEAVLALHRALCEGRGEGG